MIKRIPIIKASQLDDLDEMEMIQGYWDGTANEPYPGNNRSFSYWHGWRNGMMDRGHMRHDSASRQLAHDVVQSGYLKNLHLKRNDTNPT